jgi:DNA-binding PadR family transcriptional regulator
MALSQAIMTALIEDDLSGYELARSFDAALGFFWHASHQQIYRELKKLSQQGHVSARKVAQRGRPDKIVYALTQAGREALAQWVYGNSRLQESKDDLFVKLYSLAPENVGHLATEIEQRRQAMMQRLYLYEKIRRRHYDDPGQLPLRRQGVYLVLAAGIGAGEQFLQWCDEALAMLAAVNPDSP